jgi:hypothetical protein
MPPRAEAIATSSVDRLLPLRDRTQFAYESVNDDTGGAGMFVTRIRRASERILLTTGGITKVLEVRPDGIARAESHAYLLKSPVQLGATWPGEAGGTVRISAVDRTVRIPAGVFVGCVETTELRGGDARREITTVFCPDVGIATMEVEAWSGAEHALERATLRSFGVPVHIEGAKSE